jgi:hypothetical protein
MDNTVELYTTSVFSDTVCCVFPTDARLLPLVSLRLQLARKLQQFLERFQDFRFRFGLHQFVHQSHRALLRQYKVPQTFQSIAILLLL